jgi:hypothetical protein
MKLSHITTAIFVSASAVFSAQAQAQTISVTPQTLIMNFGAGENLMARIAQPNPGQGPANPVAPTTPIPAPTTVAPAAPVEVPSFIGGQKLGADAQRVAKCLIENHGDKYICGMQELNGEIAKCVGGVGTIGGCFTAPLTRPRDPAPVQLHRHYTTRNYYSNRFYAHYMNFF